MIDGRAWLAANIEQAKGVSDASWKTVADFTLLWSLFEAELCNRHANPNALITLVDGFGGQALDACMQAGFDYWHNRYVENGNTNQRFNELFIEPNGRNIAEPILLKQTPDATEMLKCNLLVVYRLRNNLFHGNKEIRSFNDQKDNLDHASAVLAKVMEWSGVH